MSARRPGEATGSWLPRGTRLNDLFEIDEGIAAGGMGEIYRGHAIETGDPVAIKTIRSDIAETDAALTMFRKEAKALHNLYHEAIVRYYVFSVDPTLKRPYLAMEYVSGPSLSAMVRNGPLDYDAVRVLGVRVASGLQAAHERGIIHRDISPDNVILPDADVGQAKIIDFGIARQTRAGDGTVVGDGFAGKYNYVAPEQLGLFGGEVTGASDIYSLGLVLVEAICGQPLDMRGSPVEVIEKRRQVPALAHVDRRIRPLLERMLAPDPHDRPGSMTEVAAWLRRGGTVPPAAHGGAGYPSESTVIGTRPTTQVRRDDRRPGATRSGSRLAVVFGIALLLLGAAGAAAYWLLLAPHAPSEAPAVRQETSGVSQPASSTARPRDPRLVVTQILPDVGVSPAPADMQRFLDGYAMPACSFLDPAVVAEARAAGDGYGRARGDFSAMAADFERAHGISLDIRPRQVTAAQCPVVDLMAQARQNRMLAPQLDLVGYRVDPGGALDGEVLAPKGRFVAVAVVSADGTVRVATTSTRSDGEAIPFHLALDRGSDPAGAPLLVAAVSSGQPLALLEAGNRLTADALATRLRARIEAPGDRLGASIRYVMVGGGS